MMDPEMKKLELTGEPVRFAEFIREGIIAGLLLSLFFMGPFFLRAWIVFMILVTPMVWGTLRLRGRDSATFNDAERMIRKGRYFKLHYDRVKSIALNVSGEHFGILANKRISLISKMPLGRLREVRAELEGRFDVIRIKEVGKWKHHLIMAAFLVIMNAFYAILANPGEMPEIAHIDFPEVASRELKEYEVYDFYVGLSDGFEPMEKDGEAFYLSQEKKCTISAMQIDIFPGDGFEAALKRNIFSFVLGVETMYDLMYIGAHSYFGMAPILFRGLFLDRAEVLYDFEDESVRGMLTRELRDEKSLETFAFKDKATGQGMYLSGVCKDSAGSVFIGEPWSIRPAR